jgi:glycosyltransferase involved in cell wall biosynthesis
MKSPAANARFVRAGALGIPMLAAAMAECLLHPSRALAALLQIVGPRYRPIAKLKNLIVFPAALAIARYVRTKDIDHIHAHWMTTPATVAYIVSMMTDIPWSCTAHAHDILSDNLLQQKVAGARFVRVIAQRNLRDLARLAGRDPADLHLIHVGVDIPARGARRIGSGPLQIVCAARLDPIKGHEHLLRALALVGSHNLPFQCDIVGDGPMEARLRGMIQELGLLDCVRVRGMVPYAVLLEEFRCGRYDVLVLPSVEFERSGHHEGIPVALIEAMAHGLPCIATATGCIPELIDASSGVLVPQRDANAISKALLRLGADAALRRKLGEAARTRVIEDFNAAQTTQALFELLRAHCDRPIECNTPLYRAAQ